MNRKYLNELWKTCSSVIRKHRSNIIKLIVVVALLLIRDFRVMAVALVFILVGALSRLTQEPFPVVVGFDLCLFLTVVYSYSYGWLAGFLMGSISSFLGGVLRNRQSMDSLLVPSVGYLLIAIIVSQITHLPLFKVGVIATIIYSIMMSIAFAYIRHFSINTITFFTTSLLFNYFLFENVGNVVLTIIT